MGAVVLGSGLHVRDVATVQLGTEDPVRIVAGDGKPAALINVARQIGGNTVAIADSVAGVMAGLAGPPPPGGRGQTAYDPAAPGGGGSPPLRGAPLVRPPLAGGVLLPVLRHGRITAAS